MRHDFLHDLAHLVYLYRIYNEVLGFIVILLGSLLEATRNFLHTIVKNVRETQQHGRSHIAYLKFVKHIFQVHTFNADQITGSSAVLNRIKVSRNDGTSLADYLLNEVPVNHITSDNQGRKWFSTTGAGLVCTSSDGRNVLGEFTTDNSLIPSNNVYSAAYNPATNSIMVSTECGMAEFFPSGSSRADSDKLEVRAYPNPVTPDYYGYVNIDGLPDGVLVKVVDAAGGLVRELGIAESGSIQWNLLNLDNKQVKTGVYYILVSGGPNGLSGSSVGKVMVVR